MFWLMAWHNESRKSLRYGVEGRLFQYKSIHATLDELGVTNWAEARNSAMDSRTATGAGGDMLLQCAVTTLRLSAMNLDFSHITAFALEGSCTPDAQVIGGSTLTLQPGVRSKGERSAPSNAKIMTCRGGKPGPLRTAVTTPSSKGADLTLTFHC